MPSQTESMRGRLPFLSDPATLFLMQHLSSLARLRHRLPALLAAVLLGLACGCATLFFKVDRSSRFIDMDAQHLRVEYGKEKRTEVLPNGLSCTFDNKVRLTLPDGKRVVLYQALAASGIRYLSANKHYEFIEKGPYCLVRQDGRLIFEGVYCRR